MLVAPKFLTWQFSGTRRSHPYMIDAGLAIAIVEPGRGRW